MQFINNFRALLIGLWLGAACFFSFAVAPSAFAVLPSREMAGSVVSRTLMIVNVSGLIIGLILLATSFIKRPNAKLFWVWSERFLAFLIAAACAVGQFVIAIWLSMLRGQIGKPIDEIAVDNPLRIQFNNLHQYSVWVLITAMIAALLLFFLISRKQTAVVVEKKTANEFDFQNEFKM